MVTITSIAVVLAIAWWCFIGRYPPRYQLLVVHGDDLLVHGAMEGVLLVSKGVI